ncbi:MAG: response regulator [Dehalococcoidia bacterium]
MQAEPHVSEKRLVLVVDDDQAITKLIRRNLEDRDTQVVEVTTGLDCITKLLNTRVDLILLDLKLPDFNGWGILSLLRLTESLSDMPVIVVTAEPADAAMVQQLRPDDYIQKPFEMRDLLASVKGVIGPGRANE